MSSEHTKAFRVKRAVKELIAAEADLMEIGLCSDNRENHELDQARLRVLEDDIIDFTHAMLHRLSDTLQGHVIKEFIEIPIGKSTYVVMKDDRSLRSVKALGAADAHAKLKLKAGEELFIKVGGG